MVARLISSIAVVMFLLESVYVPCCATAENPEWIVRLHNTFRTFVGVGEGYTVGNMRKMRWDRSLVKEASALAACNNLAADAPEVQYDILGIPVKGYNKAVGKHTDSALHFIRKWFEQKRHFNRKDNMCYYGRKCLNYMQLVSADTFKVGCALNRSCSVDGLRASLFVCVYSPGANLANQIYKIGDGCSLCGRSASFCEHGLCSDCHPQKNPRCECHKTCRTKKGFGVLSRHSCTCHCIFGHGPNCNEKCKNPEMYLDYDICGDVKEEECHSNDPATRAMLEEFCPEQCACRRKPRVFG